MMLQIDDSDSQSFAFGRHDERRILTPNGQQNVGSQVDSSRKCLQ